jgi:hypothetical protein
MLMSVSKRVGSTLLNPNSQMQEIWMELEANDPRVYPRAQPQFRTMEEHTHREMTLLERRAEIDRLATMRRQKCHFHVSKGLQRMQFDEPMPWDERVSAQQRLYKQPTHKQPRDKVETGLGHVLDNGERSIGAQLRDRIPSIRPKAKGRVRALHKSAPRSPAGSPEFRRRAPSNGAPSYADRLPPTGADVKAAGQSKQRPGGEESADEPATGEVNEGITEKDYRMAGWKPGESYRKYSPTKHKHDWENVSGFTTSPFLEQRKMNPLADINAFSNGGRMSGFVRPIDTKGQLGAGPLQMWKESLREDADLGVPRVAEPIETDPVLQVDVYGIPSTKPSGSKKELASKEANGIAADAMQPSDSSMAPPAPTPPPAPPVLTSEGSSVVLAPPGDKSPGTAQPTVLDSSTAAPAAAPNNQSQTATSQLATKDSDLAA